MFFLFISAEVVAWYAAIVSTTALLVRVFSYLRDKAKVFVSVMDGKIVGTGPLVGKKGIFLEAVNKGRRSITLTHAGFDLKDGSHFLILDPVLVKFPYTLEEGKLCQAMAYRNYIEEELKKSGSEIVSAWFIDSKGKKWKKKFKMKEENVK